MAKSFVVTGCLGFMGSYFTELILKEGHYVYGIDICNYAYNELRLRQFLKEYRNTFKFAKEDICTLKYLPDCDYVVNFAAQRHVDNSIVDRNEFLRTNILGVKNLLDLIKAKNIYNMPLFVMLSTDETYGDSLKEFYTETQILSPSNPYSASKCAGDMLILSYNRTYKVPYVIFRPTNNFGCWQHPEKLIPKSIQLLMRGEKIQLHDDGSAMRCWLHAEDTAKAIYGVIERNIRNEIFNISGDCWFTIKQIAEKIVRSYINVNNEKNIRCEYISYGYKRAGADIVYKIDDSKLRNLTRWKPTRLFSARDIEGDQVLDEIVKHVISNYRW